MDHPTLAEAQRIAAQPTPDRLDGKQGEEAKAIIVRLLEGTGLDFMEAVRLVESYGWSRWYAGTEAGRVASRETNRIKD